MQACQNTYQDQPSVYLSVCLSVCLTVCQELYPISDSYKISLNNNIISIQALHIFVIRLHYLNF